MSLLPQQDLGLSALVSGLLFLPPDRPHLDRHPVRRSARRRSLSYMIRRKGYLICSPCHAGLRRPFQPG